MSDRERGRKLFAELGEKVRKEIAPSGEAALHARGQRAIAELAEDLASPGGPPGLYVTRDGGDKIRLQRAGRGGQIAIRWDRPVGAVAMSAERGDKREPEVRYLHRESDDRWHRMDGDGELYEDVTKLLSDVLYPESRRGT